MRSRASEGAPDGAAAEVPLSAAAPVLLDGEQGVVDLFIRLADLLALPKSIGKLYGLLYISPRPLPMDDLMARLDLSKGATSQGLRQLRAIGAVRAVTLPGDRRDHFVAELELRRLVGGFLKEQVRPHLISGGEKLKSLGPLIDEWPEEDRREIGRRLERLQIWHHRARRLLPVLQRLIRT